MAKLLKIKELDPDFKKVECSCRKCVGYCERTPGWFRPGEIPLLARFLSLPVAEIFRKHLIADYWADNSSDIYVLAPVKDFKRLCKSDDPLQRETAKLFFENKGLQGAGLDEAGNCASWNYAFWRGPCTFLKEGKCTIYPVRPFECAIAWHGKKPAKNMRELIAGEWKDSLLISELLEKGGV